LHVDLHAWDMRVLKGAKHRVDELKKGAWIFEERSYISESIADQKEILLTIELLLEQDEMHWVKRGRAN
jgi:hypothetical protein